jgi:hypothetical protein
MNAREKQESGLLAKVWKELKSFFWIFLYLFIVFGFYTLSDDIVHRQEGIGFAAHGFAAINAAVFGKIMLIAEQMEFGRQLRRAPLAYIIAWQSFLFTLLLIASHFLEHAIVGYYRHSSPDITLDLGGGGWVGLGIVTLMVFFALVPFFAYRNLATVIGPDLFHALLFKRRRAQ